MLPDTKSSCSSRPNAACQAYEVYTAKISTTTLTHSGGTLKTKERDISKGYAIRALKDKRLGFAYCQKEDDIDHTIARAAKASRYGTESEFSFAGRLKESESKPSRIPKISLVDKKIDSLDFEELRGILDSVLDQAQSKGGKARVILSAGIGELGIENTTGFSGSYQKTYISLFADCMHGNGNGFSSYSSFTRPKSFESFGLEAAEMAKSMRGTGKPAAGAYTTILRPEAIMDILDIFIPSFSGDWKRRGITQLVAGKRRFSDELTISDDPLSAASDARPFDDEGTPSRKKVLVQKGIVHSFIYDRETAALARTHGEGGGCSRSSYDSAPSSDNSNIVIAGGDIKDLEDGFRKHIEIFSMHGSHTANQTTGDFGLEVNAAILRENGKARPIRGFMISGNVFDMFSRIVGIEKKQRIHGDLISPRIAFGNVRVVV